MLQEDQNEAYARHLISSPGSRSIKFVVSPNQEGPAANPVEMQMPPPENFAPINFLMNTSTNSTPTSGSSSSSSTGMRDEVHDTTKKQELKLVCRGPCGGKNLPEELNSTNPTTLEWLFGDCCRECKNVLM
ncbi:OLC1v1019021C1 [Oldenlandia corymbosa var. corymbosa]|uniref:OLC1v1019021C1 n=1 Tax=Oldenlandia corymbosa var. corymbosa TaxID=529605 RepID=A0AAV1ED68_OLDCO|nr:OLC1v1019021C1 [Oldenlandia corymbosa var. corymbosa]